MKKATLFYKYMYDLHIYVCIYLYYIIIYYVGDIQILNTTRNKHDDRARGRDDSIYILGKKNYN